MVHHIPTEFVLATRGLTKRFGATTAVDQLDLEVDHGRVFGLLGPNGAGKTTLLRLVVGLLRPSGGSLVVLGTNPTSHPDAVQARTGYLPGSFTAYGHLTAGAYLTYLAQLRGGVATNAVEEIAERLTLRLDRRIDTLSHGNRQKVGITQAFMCRPELLVLDEPTSGLDPLMQREFLAMVREAADAGSTVILSSHILSEVEAIADTVGILRHGRLVTLDTVENLKARAVRRIDVTFVGAPPAEHLAAINGVREVHAGALSAHLVVEGSLAPLVRALSDYEVTDLVTHEADLGEIFLAAYNDSPHPDGNR